MWRGGAKCDRSTSDALTAGWPARAALAPALALARAALALAPALAPALAVCSALHPLPAAAAVDQNFSPRIFAESAQKGLTPTAKLYIGNPLKLSLF